MREDNNSSARHKISMDVFQGFEVNKQRTCLKTFTL